MAVQNAAQQTTPAVYTAAGYTDTLDGWAKADSAVATIASWFVANYGVQALQFMSRATLDARIAALPAAPVVTASATVLNGQSVVVHNAAGAAVAGSPGAAEVAAGALTDVKLTV